LTWKILCEDGEVTVQAPGPAVNWSYEKDSITIKKYLNASGKGETADIPDMELESVQTPSRMIGRVYEAFASGLQYQTFEDALNLHRQLDKIAKGALHLEKDHN
jgi:hypothetical protein